MAEKIENISSYFFFDERGDPINGYEGTDGYTYLFFIGCVHTDDLQKVELAHKKICGALGKPQNYIINYKRLGSKKERIEKSKIILPLLLSSDLMLDFSIMCTKEFDALRKEVSKFEQAKKLFDVGHAKYSNFSKMCVTELASKIHWLVWRGLKDDEEPLKILAKQNRVPTIEYDFLKKNNASKSPLFDQTQWENAHLKSQLQKHKLTWKISGTKSKGVQIADLLVGIFSELDLMNKQSAFTSRPNVALSKFYPVFVPEHWEIRLERYSQINLEKLYIQIQSILSRNARVEADKAWETSWARRSIIAILTYAVIVVLMYNIRDPNPLFNALVPTFAFAVSASALPFAKKWWLARFYQK